MNEAVRQARYENITSSEIKARHVNADLYIALECKCVIK
jgi:hypothetical protein